MTTRISKEQKEVGWGQEKRTNVRENGQTRPHNPVLKTKQHNGKIAGGLVGRGAPG